MFAYCLNSPLNYVDTTGHMAMLKDDKLASTSCIGFYGGSFGGGNIAPIINPSTLMAEIASGICAIVAVATGILKPVEKAEDKVETATITVSQNQSAKYYGADIYGRTWKTVTGAMDYDEAIGWVTYTASTDKYGKNASWGLYTNNQNDAIRMAIAFGGPGPCLHIDNPGLYNHYHVAGMLLFNQYKHFHIWYGSIIPR